MSIQAGVCSSFHLEILAGVHTPQDVYRIALYSSAANIGPMTTAYTPEHEVKGQGYTPGGVTLTGFSITGTGRPARLDFSTVIIPNATLNARGGLVYNASKNNRAVVVVDFGMDVRSSNGSFLIKMPAVGDTTSLVRIS